MTIKVTVLGCGPSYGVPEIGGENSTGDWGQCDPNNSKNRRSRCSIYIETPQGGKILIDTGPDLRQQLLTHAISSLDAVFYTHLHADHIVGIDDLRSVNRVIKAPLPAYGNQMTLDYLMSSFSYIFDPIDDWSSIYKAQLKPHVIHEPFHVMDELVTPFDVDHGVMMVQGYRIGNFAYTPDLIRIPKASYEALEGLDVWMIDAYQYKSHPSHLNVEASLAFIEQFKPRKAILTNLGKDLDFEELSKQIPDHVSLAYDGLTFTSS